MKCLKLLGEEGGSWGATGEALFCRLGLLPLGSRTPENHLSPSGGQQDSGFRVRARDLGGLQKRVRVYRAYGLGGTAYHVLSLAFPGNGDGV